MELKARLYKTEDYEDFMRSDFIVENNHRLGYEIRETDTVIEAWGLTAEEQAEITRKAELNAELDRLESYLNSTDWMVVKCMERGLVMAETYPEDYEQRQLARDRINIIKEQLNV